MIVPFDNFSIPPGTESRLTKDQIFEHEDGYDYGLASPQKLALAERLGDRYCPLPRESDLYGAVR